MTILGCVRERALAGGRRLRVVGGGGGVWGKAGAYVEEWGLRVGYVGDRCSVTRLRSFVKDGCAEFIKFNDYADFAGAGSLNTSTPWLRAASTNGCAASGS